MKKLGKLLFVLIACVIMTMGCKNEEATPRYLKAKKDGAEWKSIFRSTLRGDIPNVSEGFVILATTGVTMVKGEYLMILIRGTETKTYDMSVNLATGIAAECTFVYRSSAADESNNYATLNGTVTLTKVNVDRKEISGTFRVKLNNTKNTTETIEITEGKFENLRYINGDIAPYL